MSSDESIKTAYERLAMIHSATLHELTEVQQRARAEAMPVNALMAEISELHDTVTALRDELMDMERSAFSDMAVMRQALEALKGVVSAHGYESGTPVEAIAALRKRLGESSE